MDIDIENRLAEMLPQLRKYAVDGIDYDQMDPIAKMMLVALVYEGQKLNDYIDEVPRKIVDRFCSHFVPYDQVGATPAIALLAPSIRDHKDGETAVVGSGASFTFKTGTSRQVLNYLPVFETLLIPHDTYFLVTPHRMAWQQDGQSEERMVSMARNNSLWVGLVTKAEIDSLQGLSLLVQGTKGVAPSQIVVGADNRRLDFSTMQEMENIRMLEPFDAQQASGQFFSFVNTWKENLLNMEDATLLYITDETHDRDIFKPRPYPRSFQQSLEDEVLDCFVPNTLWLRLDFPEGFVVPDDCQVSLNVLPVVNVDVNSVMLTKGSPIAKLQKQEDSFFLCVHNPSAADHQQGLNEKYVIRDFDASCYHHGELYREVRNLYNHFHDDYYAFTEYHGIKDGENLSSLRRLINDIGHSVGKENGKFKFDSGTYVMRSISDEDKSSATRVTYLTTMGAAGNKPKVGDTMDCRKLPIIEQKVPVLVAAAGGTDKASVDVRYELLRYYALTNDRLYTKMDVDAFLRKELIAEFGQTEFRRIFIRISIQGAAGERGLRRGLYIYIEFKDRKNYEHAIQCSFDTLMRQRIENHSCIAMPIIVRLVNLEG